jgi:hypothetical protein
MNRYMGCNGRFWGDPVTRLPYEGSGERRVLIGRGRIEDYLCSLEALSVGTSVRVEVKGGTRRRERPMWKIPTRLSPFSFVIFGLNPFGRACSKMSI